MNRPRLLVCEDGVIEVHHLGAVLEISDTGIEAHIDGQLAFDTPMRFEDPSAALALAAWLCRRVDPPTPRLVREAYARYEHRSGELRAEREVVR